MNKNKGKVSGTEEAANAKAFEKFRQDVIMDELRARHWKAVYDTAYYHMEWESIRPKYKEFIEAQEAARAAELAELKKRLEEAGSKELTIEELQKTEGLVGGNELTPDLSLVPDVLTEETIGATSAISAPFSSIDLSTEEA